MSSAAKHQEISKIGEELLKEAIEKANPGKEINLQSFYLGNWLTDFSQGIDPVAFKKFEKLLTEPLDEFSDSVLDVENAFKKIADDSLETLEEGVEKLRKLKSGVDIFDDTLKKIFIEIGNKIDSTQEKVITSDFSKRFREQVNIIRNSIESFISGGNTPDEEHPPYSEFEWAIRSTVAVIGYSKFVLADDLNDTKNKMDNEIYESIIKRNLTQYFPHEHLDRPDTFNYQVQNKSDYITQLSPGPLSKNSQIKEIDNHLYQYIRDDIHILAGLLTKVDQNWGKHTFNENKEQFIGEDNKVYPIENSEAWDAYLADLGHALHGVEDYFAHSNFIEHAHVLAPNAFEKLRAKEPIYSRILSKRLLQWPGPGLYEKDNGKEYKFQSEPHIATGYFDIIDTFHSLSHMVEALFDWPHELLFDKGQHVVDKITSARETDHKKFLTDTLELLSLKDEDEFANYEEKLKIKNTENEALNLLLETDVVKNWKVIFNKDDKELIKRTKKIEEIAIFLSDERYGVNAPPYIKIYFKDSIVYWTKIKAGISLYKSLKSLVGFISNPIKWLKNKIPDFLGTKSKELLIAYGTSYFHQFTGAQRIGCHSLIAKDIGDEIFHKPSFQCAQSVHWYIIYQLINNQKKRMLKIKSSDLKSREFNKLALSENIDWLELLEYFLSHPASFVKKIKKVKKTYISDERFIIDTHKKPSTLKELAAQYGTYYKEITGINGQLEYRKEVLTWEILARYNYPVLAVDGYLSKKEFDNLSKENQKVAKAGLEKEINRILELNNIGYPVKNNMAFQTGTVVLIPGQKKTIEINESQESSEKTVDNWWYQVSTSKKSWEVFKNWSEKQELVSNQIGKLVPPHQHIPVRVNKQYIANLITSSEKLKQDEEIAYNNLIEIKDEK
ncbi:MAG: hypothetical protein OQL19_09930 [Gammaproteobacteria bacterium]|nr:hypothetical protein [Gammaproteobacteria bacterium]